MPAWAASHGIECLIWTAKTSYPHKVIGGPDDSVVLAWTTPASRTKGISADIENIHSLWAAATKPGKHPLGALVKAWQFSQGVPVEPDRRETGILPGQVQAIRHTVLVRNESSNHDIGVLSLDQSLGWRSDGQGYLPSMEPLPSALVPSLPLVLYDGAGGASLAKGQGAPLALRLFVEIVLAVPLDQRGWRTRLELPLPELIRFLWPNGWHSLKRDGPRLGLALHQIDQARISWAGGCWRPVSLTNLPGSPTDNVVLDVELPKGSGRGPMVYRPTLRQLGVRSAPEYRAYLGLAALRNRYLTANGKLLAPTVPEVRRDASGALLDAFGKVVLGKGGIPVKHWSDKRAVRTGKQLRNPELDRLPWLSDTDLVALCYPESFASTSSLRMSVTRSKTALSKMAASGMVKIEREFPRGVSERSKGRWRMILTELP